MSLFSRTDRSFLGRWWWTIDRTLLVCFLLLAIMGVVLVTTASPPVAERINLDSYHFLKRHMMFLLPSLVGMGVVSMMPPRMVWRLASIVFILSLFAMLAVLFVGDEIKGARRWIRLFGFSVQPSEFAKVSFAIVSAWFMAQQKEKKKFPGYAVSGGLYLLTVLLIILEPDLGMTMAVTLIWCAQVFLAGFPFRFIAVLTGIVGGGVMLAYHTLDHVHSRIDRFLNPAAGDNYQVEKSIEAIQNGGVFGVGPGQGIIKQSLPDAHADFIFSVGAEEMGLLFVLIILCLYGFILLRGFNRMMDNNNMFCVLAAGGLLTMIGFQAFVHMGSAMNVLPAKGMTLPFISYGGSSLLTVGFAMGAILALTRRDTRPNVAKSGVSLRSVNKKNKRKAA